MRKDTRTFTKPAKEDPVWTLWAKPRRRAASDRAPSVRWGPDELGSPPASRLSSRPVLRPGVTRRWLRQGGFLFSACPAEARPLLSGGVTRTSRAPHAPRSDGGPGPGSGQRRGGSPWPRSLWDSAGWGKWTGRPSFPATAEQSRHPQTHPADNGGDQTRGEPQHPGLETRRPASAGDGSRGARSSEAPGCLRLGAGWGGHGGGTGGRAAALPTRPQTVPRHTGDWAPHSR